MFYSVISWPSTFRLYIHILGGGDRSLLLQLPLKNPSPIQFLESLILVDSTLQLLKSFTTGLNSVHYYLSFPCIVLTCSKNDYHPISENMQYFDKLLLAQLLFLLLTLQSILTSNAFFYFWKKKHYYKYEKEP